MKNFILKKRIFLLLFLTLALTTADWVQAKKIHKKQKAIMKIVISPNHFGPIHSKTPFNQKQLQRLFPKCLVKDVKDNGLAAISQFNVFCFGKLWLSIFPQENDNSNSDNSNPYVGKVVVYSTEVQSMRGVKVSDPFAKLALSGSMDCYPVSDEMFSCHLKEQSNIAYYAKKSGQMTCNLEDCLPDSVSISKIAIQSIVWTAAP